MRRTHLATIAIAAILVSAVAGYRIGAGAWPGSPRPPESTPANPAPINAERDPRKVLYWKDPDGKAEYSADPKKTAAGRDYVPVHDDEEPGFAGLAPEKPKGKGKVLYYRNPMGLPDTSPAPKKDWMGMDYIPVYEGEEQEAGTVRVSLDKVQRAGVRTAPAEMRKLARPVRAPGIAKPDERTLYTVTLRADGFIEKLYVSETGRQITKGEPLFRLYSPQMVAAQVDFRIANTVGARDDRGAAQRLRNLGMPEKLLEELQRTRTPVISFDWPAPVSGVVMQKNVTDGQMVKAGEPIFRLADLGSIWVVADVAEQDIGQVRIGDRAKLSFRAFPGESFQGRVTFVLHELDAATRTAKVRIEVDNPEHRIKHEMFADVEIAAGADEPERLVVPAAAVIDSGKRQVVIVDRGEGRFEPRPVRLGTRGEGFVEILDGLRTGESVVGAANFLIDAESNLRAALSGFMSEAPKASLEQKEPIQ